MVTAAYADQVNADISSRSFLSFVQSVPTSAQQGDRGVFNTVPVANFTPAVLAAVQNETTVRVLSPSPAIC
ncbi:hypothetical protein B0H21DRAFT_733013 [Amylocystis lapponica]|nr:hypothetical protein B0H21DRAFT_733013 [Amylocystis lapponica]